jgi:hypothetical protein
LNTFIAILSQSLGFLDKKFVFGNKHCAMSSNLAGLSVKVEKILPETVTASIFLDIDSIIAETFQPK